MTKQEQIEEMAKIVDEMYNVYTTTADEIAERLYNAGYRKIQDGTVVLSREEYEMLKSLYDTQKGAIMTSSIGDLPLTVEGLRKAVDEITRLNRVETELQELNAKYYNEAKDLRRELKLKTTDADIPIKINDAPLEELSESDESESRKIRRKKDKKVDVSWMIEYAQNEVRTIGDAKAIKDMLMCYFLNVCKSPNADIFELLQRIERIPYEYDKNHPKQPIVGKAAQVVVTKSSLVIL